MPKLTYRDASLAAIQHSMREDQTVWCVGEDLGRGGVFGSIKDYVKNSAKPGFPMHQYRKRPLWARPLVQP